MENRQEPIDNTTIQLVISDADKPLRPPISADKYLEREQKIINSNNASNENIDEGEIIEESKIQLHEEENSPRFRNQGDDLFASRQEQEVIFLFLIK